MNALAKKFVDSGTRDDMLMSDTDMRIPIVIGAKPGPDDAALVEDGWDMPKSGYAVRFARGETRACV